MAGRTSTFDAAHPAPHRDRVGAFAQIVALCGPPVAWSLLELVQYGFASNFCFPGYQPHAHVSLDWMGLRLALLGVAIAALAVAAVSLAVAWRLLRRTAEEHHGAVGELLEVGEGRTRFLAVWSVLFSVGFLFAILFQILALVLVPPCAP